MDSDDELEQETLMAAMLLMFKSCQRTFNMCMVGLCMVGLMDSDDDDELEQQTLMAAAMLLMLESSRRCHTLNMCMVELMEVENDRPLSGPEWIMGQLEGHHSHCYDQYRMSTDNFNALCKELKLKGLQANGDVIVEEQVGMFLQCLGQAHNMRKIGEDFQHSIETDALGAIYGMHVLAFPNKKDKCKERFIDRKGNYTQNVMAAVDFDGNFLAVVAGWEGSVRDNMILRSAFEDGFLFVPTGKYYLVDTGYANTPQFLAPYHRISYHLGTFRDRACSPGEYPYDKPEELFNHRHAQLRNVVERSFGVLKGRFHILKDMAPFEFKIQVKIVGACCTLHNFINHQNRLHNVSDETLFQVPEGNNGSEVGDNGEDEDSQDGDVQDIDLQNRVNLRERIKNSLWQMMQHA